MSVDHRGRLTSKLVVEIPVADRLLACPSEFAIMSGIPEVYPLGHEIRRTGCHNGQIVLLDQSLHLHDG